MERAQIQFNDFKEVIDYYHKHRKTEYEIKHGIITPHNNILYQQGLGKPIHQYENKSSKLLIDDVAVERFHPNKINNKEFWTYAKQKFPKFSVCGGKSKTIKHCNEQTLGMARDIGFVGFIENLIQKSPTKLEFFEIGYGHGNIFFELKDKVNYLGIDFYKIKKLNKYKNLMTIHKSGIPYMVKKDFYDLVYSVNVLQHCSQHDRFEYFEQAYERLKSGGYFIASCLLQCNENENSHVWGLEDASGRRYCNFFNQLTEVDKLVEFDTKIKEIGFHMVDYKLVGGNNFFFVLQK